ncbi:hypothetical protein [Gluconacetobacter tumulisoli]
MSVESVSVESIETFVNDPERFAGIQRDHDARDVARLSGSVDICPMLAGFHSLNYSMFKLAHGYAKRDMAACSELQEAEFGAVAAVARDGHTSIAAMAYSTETDQFHAKLPFGKNTTPV